MFDFVFTYWEIAVFLMFPMAFISFFVCHIFFSSRQYVFLIACLFLNFNIYCDHEKTPSEVPFHVGEKLEYKIFWTGIPVGTCVVEVKGVSEINGKKCWHFVLNAKTNAFADVFYKVREHSESFTAFDLSRSYLYEAEQLEKGKIKKVRLIFDWDRKQLKYIKNGKDRGWKDILENSFDVLGMFYALRSQKLKDKKEISFRVSDQKTSVETKMKITNGKKIKFKAKKYKTYLCIPDMKSVRGVFKKSDDAELKMWVSQNDIKIPLKISSKVVVGRFTATLVAFKKKKK
ncbi:MAG: DUF3108 domain-containing protein [Verrucomicrobiota bacterium]|nr:DUF3108 domain-containing protein [Verrucomicrobiota bacterium]